MSPVKSLSGDAATAYADFAAAGGTRCDWRGTLDGEATLLVDALLGSGLDRAVEGRFAEVVEAINRHPAPVLALDIPSGIHGDSGNAMGVAVEADMTVTFVGLKIGLFLADGAANTGVLKYSDLAIPVDCRAGKAMDLRRINDGMIRENLRPRHQDAHKGDFGHLVVVGGGPGMPGAIALCGEAALRCGAGRVSLATHPDHSAAIAAACPEIMCRGISTAADLEILLTQASTVVIGPGLGQTDWSHRLFTAAVESGIALVMDADALNILSHADRVSGDRPEWILTPHPGEAARLLHSTNADVQNDRRKALAALQRQYGDTIVLKGAGTLVSSASGPAWLCTAGNPGMAAPGMGDVLAGVIGSMLAQGLAIEIAATVGVQLHARAGDLAAVGGERGLMAGDLMAPLRQLVNPT